VGCLVVSHIKETRQDSHLAPRDRIGRASCPRVLFAAVQKPTLIIKSDEAFCSMCPEVKFVAGAKGQNLKPRKAVRVSLPESAPK
jgi:hypothetical protein